MSFQGREQNYFCLFYIASYQTAQTRALRLEGIVLWEYLIHLHTLLGSRLAPRAPLDALELG